MTISTAASDPSDDDLSTNKTSVFKYDLRLEITVKEVGVTVPVVSIFYDFVRHLKEAADVDAPVAVLTAHDKLFFENNEMTSDEFQKAFKVDNTEGKVSKVMLGFKIHTLTRLSELKRRLMHAYLIPHNLFLRQHVGGFDHGIKSYYYGFLKDDHPDHPDISMLKQRFARITSNAWKKIEKDDRQKWRQELPHLFYGNSGIALPVNFSKERIIAAFDGKDKMITSALMVSTSTKYGKLLKALLDIALAQKQLNNLIPFALNRENPEGYYYMVAHQARFMENHRNIPIMNIPPDANTQPGQKGTILVDKLNANPAIQRVSYDLQHQKYHVSTTAMKYKEVHQWIANLLNDHQFPYVPSIRPMQIGPSSGNKSGISYSEIFKDAMSQANESYETSTIKTTQSNAWKNRPPLAISYELSDAAFPTLPRPKNQRPMTSSTTSETLDEDTIQSAISAAIKKMEEKHRYELAQLKEEMQQKIDQVANQMKELGQEVAIQTYQALIKEESPLATKTDQVLLQHRIDLMSTQLSTILNLIQTPNQRAHLNNIPPQDINITVSPVEQSTNTVKEKRNFKRTKPTDTPEKAARPSMDALTQDHSVSSAASHSAESMEGCED